MFLNQLINIGRSKAIDYQDEKLRRLFNIMNLAGALIAIPQIIIAFSRDTTAGWFHVAWLLGCLLSLPVHKYFGFHYAKISSFTLILIFGHLAAARLGPDTLPHLASYGITVFIFMIYDVRKEWTYLLFFLLLEIGGILLVESKVLYAGVAPTELIFAQRIFLIVGVLLFILMEFVFFIRLTQTNERKVINELQHANQELAKSNRENRLLLKEVHHRVKNNLQLVSSLLNMQMQNVANTEAEEQFMDASSRIRSIAMLHQKVYQGETLHDIDFHDYLHTVGSELLHTYCPGKQIELDIKSDILHLDNDALMPIALIFNELISNSIKHGLKDKNEGVILISVGTIEGEHYLLSYCDNGTWIEPKNEQSIGLELIRSLAEQLDGDMRIIKEDNQACFKIDFYINRKKSQLE